MKSTMAARICGKDFTCAIPRDTLHLFEALHGSANALLSKLRAGAWTVADLASIIDYAIAPPDPAAAAEAVYLRSKQPDRASIAGAAFLEKGAATYLPLAMGLLIAALYGVPEGAGAFTDEDDGESA